MLEAENSNAEQSARREQEQLSRWGMRFLTGGLTEEGDAFLIAVGAVILTAVLYPLIGGWAFLAFPIVFLGAWLARSQVGRNRG